MITEKHIMELVAEGLSGTDKFPVTLTIKTGNKIMVFIDGDIAVTIDDCVRLSRYIESRLDRNVEDYELMVSSSGADRPLLMPRQYPKHLGRLLRVITADEQQITGALELCTNDGITIKVAQDKKKKIPESTVFIAFQDIKESKIELSFKK